VNDALIITLAMYNGAFAGINLVAGIQQGRVLGIFFGLMGLATSVALWKVIG
jgi:hypothetical protein